MRIPPAKVKVLIEEKCISLDMGRQLVTVHESVKLFSFALNMQVPTQGHLTQAPHV